MYSGRVFIPRRSIAVLAAPVGGFLAHLVFPQASIWPLAFVGLAILFWASQGRSARWAFFVGLLWSIGHFLPLLWWAHEAVGPLPWVALSVFESAIMALAPAMYVWIMRLAWFSRWKVLAAIPFGAAWVVAEQIRHQWPFGGFPWVRIAFSQTDGPLLNLAPYGGAPLVSFVVASLAAVLAVGVMALVSKDIWRVPLTILLIVAGLLAPMLIALDTRAESGTITVGAVQGNVSNQGMDDFANARDVTNNHLEGTQHMVDHFMMTDVV